MNDKSKQKQYKQLLKLYEKAKKLNEIVEGVQSVRWSYDGKRLKDTKEWCEFYCALCDHF